MVKRVCKKGIRFNVIELALQFKLFVSFNQCTLYQFTKISGLCKPTLNFVALLLKISKTVQSLISTLFSIKKGRFLGWPTSGFAQFLHSVSQSANKDFVSDGTF